MSGIGSGIEACIVGASGGNRRFLWNIEQAEYALEIETPNERRDDAVAVARQHISLLFEKCESPIERLMAPWLACMNFDPVAHGPILVFSSLDDADLDLPMFIIHQYKIGGRRLDFALFTKYGDLRRIFAFECDGLEFHNRGDDIFRDAELALLGILTFRSWGQEIVRAPHMVAFKLQQFIEKYATMPC